VRTKAPFPGAYLEGADAPALVAAYYELNQLKQLYRQGWLRRGIPPERCESVAEHSFAVALLALFLVDAVAPDLDRGRVTQMALLHDLGEVYAGDLTPGDDVSDADKRASEERSVARVLSKLPGGADCLALWHEYEHGSTPEARFVRQVDRLEMALQAGVYEHQEGRPLPDFWESAQAALSNPALRALLEAARALRPDGSAE